jgi:mannose-6-phosphate isomerase-like protein (cupin superfamily)
MTVTLSEGGSMESVRASDPSATYSSGSYGAPNCVASGDVSGALFHPDDFSLWRVEAELGEDAVLEWDTRHGDEALFVVTGAVDWEGRRVGGGSALIVEAGVPAIVHSAGRARVVHFGPEAIDAPTDGILGAPVEDGRRVHIVPPEHAPSIHFSGGDGATSVYFCDGTCPTCRITLFLYDGSAFSDGYSGASHFHSQDEIIHVLDGELRFGAVIVGPGASIAVPRYLRYSFRTSGPFRYLDYRADVSTAVVAPGSDPVLETVANLTGLGGEVRDRSRSSAIT